MAVGSHFACGPGMSTDSEQSVAAREGVPTISRDELAAALSSDHPPALFEVLPVGYWKKHHLPGAITAPPEQAAATISRAESVRHQVERIGHAHRDASLIAPELAPNGHVREHERRLGAALGGVRRPVVGEHLKVSDG